ncbi:hypothetical protein HanXRQr2_Chr17g0811621 [Helianthus annuus]|uniref:Uncharacterized protein n=1 Tax=Helianthus annuus TaxID=4232 RepID=A0A9K3DK55_HELAN|nr:hypothetical protein HanXRQr2_Chr17g0811621 [Helianthus annuus]
MNICLRVLCVYVCYALHEPKLHKPVTQALWATLEIGLHLIPDWARPTPHSQTQILGKGLVSFIVTIFTTHTNPIALYLSLSVCLGPDGTRPSDPPLVRITLLHL